LALDVDPGREFGSLEEQFLTLAQAFKRHSSLLLPVFRRPLGPEAAAEYRDGGLRAEALDWLRFSPARFGRLLSLVRREKIDILHWNFCSPAWNVYSWGLSRLVPGLVQVYSDHGSGCIGAVPHGSSLKKLADRWTLGRPPGSLCIGDCVHGHLQSHGTFGPLGRCSDFVNTARFAPATHAAMRERTRLELGDACRFVALLVAHLIPESGGDVAIRALAQLPDCAALWIIGEGPESGRLESLARENSVSERVRFLGHRRHVECYLQAADCLVCPSRDVHAVARLTIEALASGLPVVASAVGRIPEIVEEDSTGFLIPPGNVSALAQRLRRLIDEPGVRLGMSRNARADALDRFSPDVVVPEYLDFYRQLLPAGGAIRRVAQSF
jgi:glycosyltransferase involved in cell wall biosynthesis